MPHDLTHAVWRTSSRSQGDGNCVEIAQLSGAGNRAGSQAGHAGVRDSKDRSGPVLTFAAADWRAFTAAAKSGDFDR